jgi:hypothetical protein
MGKKKTRIMKRNAKLSLIYLKRCGRNSGAKAKSKFLFWVIHNWSLTLRLGVHVLVKPRCS